MESEKKITCPKCSKIVAEEGTNFCPFCGLQVSSPCQFYAQNSYTDSEQESIEPSSFDAPTKSYQLAGFWIRLGAFWMDFLIILLIAMFLGSLVYSTALGRQLFPNIEKINLFMILLFIFYHALFISIFRTTPGKKFFGLSVIPKKTFTRFGYAEAFLRTLSYSISAFFFGIGFLWIALNRYKQGWHDKIAKTLVVRKLHPPLLRRTATLAMITLVVFILIALQFNLTWVYQSSFNPGHSLRNYYGIEVVSVLVTQQEIREGIFKEVNTRTGAHAIKLPSSAHDGDIFKVNRSEEEGGVFYIRIVIVEWV